MLASNINWKKVGEVYKFRDCVLALPQGCQLQIIPDYNGEFYDLYICMPYGEAKINPVPICGKVVYVSFDNKTQALIDEGIQYLASLMIGKRKNLIRGKITRYVQNTISVTRIGEEFVYLKNVIFEDSEVHQINYKCLQILFDHMPGDMSFYIEQGHAHAHLQKIVDLNKAISQAANTLYNQGVYQTMNPYIIEGLKECGFLHVCDQVAFYF